MTSNPSHYQQLVSNPICGYYVEGELDTPESYEVVLELHGEAGERSTVTIACSEQVMMIAELLMRAADDLAFAEEHGIGALAERVGTAESDVLTVDDVLRAAPRDPED